LFIIPNIYGNLHIFQIMYFSSSYEILYPKYVNVSTCSNVVLCITILFLVETCPLYVITL
jgi:hypothetical protein